MAPQKEECFVIMPISDPNGYDSGHFQHVYDDIITPACIEAGYKPVRADDVNEANMIHLDVLKRILESPMAICDLSSRNPNVLFELGIRQAFDKPVVLIQEKGTPRIFDIAPLRVIDYDKSLIYHQVLEDQNTISKTISATKKAIGNGNGINSIVKLLALTSPASINEIDPDQNNPMLQMVMAEINALKKEFHLTKTIQKQPARENDFCLFPNTIKHLDELNDILKMAKKNISNPESIADLRLGQVYTDRAMQFSEGIDQTALSEFDKDRYDRMQGQLMMMSHFIDNKIAEIGDP